MEDNKVNERLAVTERMVESLAFKLPKGVQEWVNANSFTLPRVYGATADGKGHKAIYLDDLRAILHLHVESDDFTIKDEELNLLLNLAVDMATRDCGMDTGLWFLDTLERVMARLGKDINGNPVSANAAA